MVRSRWASLPPVMERTLRDDLKWALFVVTGATLGYVVLGADDPWLLVGFVVGAAAVIAVMNVVRRVAKPRRKA